MYCKNCGTKLNDNARVCPECGAFVDDSSGYTLLTADNRVADFYSDEPKPPKKKSSSALSFIISLILVVAIAGGGAYYYFTHIKPQEKPAPEVNFTVGSGMINEDESVIYAKIEDNMSIQYIHGVKLYKADYTQSGVPKDAVAALSDYEYTKNIDGTFRTIFFDAGSLDFGKKTTYTFEIKLSFLGSNDVYTYLKAVDVKKIKGNVADTVFDHSNAKVTESESTTAQSAEAKTEIFEDTTKPTEKEVDTAFVYESYWFTQPVTEGKTRTIFAFKFNHDNTFVSTKYEQKNGGNWSVTTYNGSFKIEDGYIVVTEKGSSEKSYYKIGENELTEEVDGETVQSLTSRQYNSIKNVEDFFGI